VTQLRLINRVSEAALTEIGLDSELQSSEFEVSDWLFVAVAFTAALAFKGMRPAFANR
jgi:hypothetical protein